MFLDIKKTTNISVGITVWLIYAYFQSGLKGTPFVDSFFLNVVCGLIFSFIFNMYFENLSKTWMWTSIILVALSFLGHLLLATLIN